MTTKAGDGEHHYYFLKLQDADPNDTAILEARKHYLGVDAVRWYVNQQGSIFSDRIASGTIQLALADETYEVGMGTYQLESGARTAPVFNRPILPNRIYRGGRLTVKVFVRAIQKDTLLGGLLRDMANASLDVVAGAVGAATGTGPLPILIAAGTSLTGGVKKILNEGTKGFTVFDPAGVDITVSSTDIIGKETYLLIHRGEKLDKNRLKLTNDQDGAFEVIYNRRPLDDGAWVLLRLRREDKYGSPRAWEDARRKAVSEIDDLIDHWEMGGINQEQAQKDLTPLNTDPPSLGDRVLEAVAKIRADYVLTEREATKVAAELRFFLTLAQTAVRETNPQKYYDERNKVISNLKAGLEPHPLAAKIFTAEASRIASVRYKSLISPAPELAGQTLWRTLQYV